MPSEESNVHLSTRTSLASIEVVGTGKSGHSIS